MIDYHHISWATCSMSPGVSPVLFVSPCEPWFVAGAKIRSKLAQKPPEKLPTDRRHPRANPPPRTQFIHSWAAGDMKGIERLPCKDIGGLARQLILSHSNFNMSEPFPKSMKINIKLFDAKCSRGTYFFLHYLSCPIISLSKSQRAHPQRCHWRPERATGRNRFSTFCLLLDRLQGNEEERERKTEFKRLEMCPPLTVVKYHWFFV